MPLASVPRKQLSYPESPPLPIPQTRISEQEKMWVLWPWLIPSAWLCWLPFLGPLV